MEGDDEVNQAPKVIKGKDLPGAVSVMPGGLGAALAKRKSREVTMEQKENSMTFSSDGQEQTFSTSSASKQESTATATKIQQGTTSSANFSSSSNFQQQSVQKSSFSSSTSSAAAASTQQVKSILKQPSAPKHGEEIHQESLKTTIQSAITDIEEGLDKTDYADKENMAPQQQQQQILQQQQQEAEMMRQEQERLLQQQQEQFRMQQEEQLRIQKQQAMEQSAATNATQNGHFNASDLRLHDEQRAKLRTPHEFKARPESISVPDGLYTPQELDLPDPTTMGKRVETVQQQQQFLVQESHDTTINGSHSEETKHHLSLDQTLGDGSITLGQVMTPCQDQDYDTNSLKRRNPRQMFTDSAFYSPKFHPSVQEQVEMAHALSSSLYTNDNKMSKGQEMYLKRAKKSDDGTTIELLEIPMRTPESAPNLKLVMNPEGKMHDYSDLPEEEVPDMSQMVMVGNPDVAKALAEGMNECKGRGKVTSPNFKDHATPKCGSGMPATSPQNMAGNKPSFAGGFRQVFDSRRGMFEQIVSNSGNFRPNITDNNQTHKNQLARSKTLPDMPKISDLQKNLENEEELSGSASLKRPCFQAPPSPLVPKRTSSKQMVAQMSFVDGNDSIRRPLRNFFYNA